MSLCEAVCLHLITDVPDKCAVWDGKVEGIHSNCLFLKALSIYLLVSDY